MTKKSFSLSTSRPSQRSAADDWVAQGASDEQHAAAPAKAQGAIEQQTEISSESAIDEDIAAIEPMDIPSSKPSRTVKPARKKTAKSEDKPEPMRRLSLDLPESMHRDLMVYCITHKTKAADLLRKLITKQIYTR